MTDILLITPPFVQLNTPYPATAYLKGFLNTQSISASQLDLGIEVLRTVFCRKGLQELFEFAASFEDCFESDVYRKKEFYLNTVDEVIKFLRGVNPGLARTINTGNYLPEGRRFQETDYLDWSFGSMGFTDRARHLATLYFEDLCDFITTFIDEDFGVSRYAESIAMSAYQFDDLFERINGPVTFIEEMMLRSLQHQLEAQNPQLVCFTIPFPGNVLSAFKCAHFIKSNWPKTAVAFGGGYPNTELRELKDERVFAFTDFVSLDDGELPLELIWKHIQSGESNDKAVLKRTFHLSQGKVFYNNLSLLPDYKQKDLGTPDYSDFDLSRYISVIEMANPMHSLWNDGRWLKLTMAHGCYWGKCTFCDISLDYIGNYEPLTAKLLVDRMEEMIHQTGETGFHFVDEAAPPALMRELALEIIRRGLTVQWWTNIRFEKSFTNDLCRLLSASGCIAVSGGLEVASNRLLELIDKGVTVEQVALAAHNFTQNGMLVHAYLMYGYASQTVEETVDSLEMVRQLFESGVLQSAYWHQFSMTAHSPVGKDPERFGVVSHIPDSRFALNDLPFSDATGIDHERFSDGLKSSLYNFMYGVGFDKPLQDWFDFEIPETTISPDFISNVLEEGKSRKAKSSDKLIWLGSDPETFVNEDGDAALVLHNIRESIEISLPHSIGHWLHSWLLKLKPTHEVVHTFAAFKKDYELQFLHFDLFWESEEMEVVREIGLNHL
ncbi:MAG: radical SAM protein [Bacteroidetes bacterium]|nr:radical SAM protein [Bacteroidota bacterium]